jgi:hypothetical protein
MSYSGQPATNQMAQHGGYTNDIRIVISIGVLVVLVLGVVYSRHIPESIVEFIHTVPGRLISIVGIILLAVNFGFSYAVLAAMIVLLLLSRSLVKIENFTGQPEPSIRIVSNRHMWFVENVLNENPFIIEEDTVKTNTIQDLNEKGIGSVQNRSVQNNSVQSR